MRRKLTILIFVILIARSRTEFSEAKHKSVNSSERSSKIGLYDLSSRQEVPIGNGNNIARILDALLNRSDFQPLVISMGHYRSSLHSGIHDKAIDYFRERSLDLYKFDLKNGHGWSVLPIGITWIILVDDWEGFEARINEIGDLWVSANRFVIFSLDDRQGSADRAHFLCRFLWNERRVAEVAIFLIHEEFRYVYRYAPFAKIGKDYGRIDRLDFFRWNNCSGQSAETDCPRDVKKPRSLFEDFSNLNGYPIPVTIFPSLMMEISLDRKNRTTYKLLDANVMSVMEKQLRANFIVDDNSVTGSDDPFESALGQLDSPDKAEIVFTGYFETLYNGSYSFTASIFRDKLCMVAPSSTALPKFFMPLLPFSSDLWLLLITLNFLVVLLWIVLQRFEAKFKRRIGRNRTVLAVELSMYTKHDLVQQNGRPINFATYRPSVTSLPSIDGPFYGTTCRMEIFRGPPRIHRRFIRIFDFLIFACSPLQRGKTNAERAFLFGTLFFATIMLGLYNSNLVSSLSKPIYHRQLQTLRDVVNSNRTIFTKYGNLMRNLPTDGSWEIEEWRSKIRAINATESTNDLVAFRGMVALTRSTSFKLEDLTPYYDLENNRPLLHLVEECAASYFVAYVVKKNSPYLPRINTLLLRMHQSGLIRKWYDDMREAVKMAVNKRKRRRPGKRVKLTLAHLSLAFLGLGIGLFFSALMYLGEIYLATKYRLATARLTIRQT